MPWLFVASLMHGVPAGAADEADRIVGLWATDKGEAHVEIFKQDGRYWGKIVWLKEPLFPPEDAMAGREKVDRENPDAGLRDRPILGLQIIKGFVYSGGERWEEGTIYDPDNGKTYQCKMWLTESGTLKVRGYIGFSLLGRTTEWLPVVGAGSR